MVKPRWKMNPVVWGMILASSLALTIQMYWAVFRSKTDAYRWKCDNVNVAIMFVLLAVISLLISKWLGHQVVKDLGVVAAKLSRVQIALRRMDPLQSSGRCIEWLKTANDWQGTVQGIKLGYDGCGLNCLERLNFSYKAEQMLDIGNSLLSEGDKLLRKKYHLCGTMKFYLKEVIDFIEARRDGSNGLLGIWGMGGVGKSSLLKLIFDSRSQYDNGGTLKVMLVCAGTTCTVGQVQKDIATSTKLSTESNETSQEENIREHLSGTSFLLLLDDLWGYLDLKAVGIPSPLGRAGRCTVVLATRNKDLCHKMGCGRDNIIQMECFDEEDAWELYRRGWPVNRVGPVDDASQGILPEQTSRQLEATQPHTIFGVQPQHLQDDRLSGMMSSYEKMRYFIEDQGAQQCLLGVWGMRGVGKTSLLRLVRDSYTRNSCFDHIMFVGAGTGCLVTNVQDAIAINLDLDLSSLDDLFRTKHIFNYLKHKSFLLLLDDIREPLNLWAVGLPRLSHQRQKIILATRSEAACALMGCHTENTIEMQCLGKDEAWNLFRNAVGLRIIDDHPQVHRLAEQMVSWCGGLPLALCALGQAMSNKKDPREWRSAYSRFMAVHLEPCEIDDKAVTSILNALYG